MPHSARKLVAGLVGTVVILSTAAISPAQADPTPTPTPSPSAKAPSTSAQIKDVKAEILDLEDQISQLGEDHAEAQQALDEGKDRLKVLQADIAVAQSKVDELADQVQSLALLQFRNRELDPTLQIFTSSDPQNLLNRLSTANKVDQDMNDTYAAHAAAQANLSDLQQSQQAEVATLAERESRIAGMKADLDAKVAKSKEMLSQLTAKQQAELDAALRGNSAFDMSELDPSLVNAKIRGAIQYATSKVPNSQYVWGSSGPNSFDCSGLMLAAYRSVGINLPHSSRAQSGIGRPVSRSELKPGDLIFFYRPIHHVGMYIGNGKFVHARNTRADLVIQTVSSYGAPWAGARRVIG